MQKTVYEHRTGGGVTRRTVNDPYREKPRTPGVFRQDFYSSPRLKLWFAKHDFEIDERLRQAEIEELRRWQREHRRFLRKRREAARRANAAKGVA